MSCGLRQEPAVLSLSLALHYMSHLLAHEDKNNTCLDLMRGWNMTTELMRNLVRDCVVENIHCPGEALLKILATNARFRLAFY